MVKKINKLILLPLWLRRAWALNPSHVKLIKNDLRFFFQLFLKLFFALAKIVAVRTMFVVYNRKSESHVCLCWVCSGYRNFIYSGSPHLGQFHRGCLLKATPDITIKISRWSKVYFFPSISKFSLTFRVVEDCQPIVNGQILKVSHNFNHLGRTALNSIESWLCPPTDVCKVSESRTV